MQGDDANMCVLVTGGAGYIGSHAMKVLRVSGYDVVGLEDLSTGAASGGRRRGNSPIP